MNFTINGAHFSIGLILDAAVSFLAVAAAVYFLIVMPMNKLAERRTRGSIEIAAGSIGSPARAQHAAGQQQQ